jgi:hypothetical protein
MSFAAIQCPACGDIVDQGVTTFEGGRFCLSCFRSMVVVRVPHSAVFAGKRYTWEWVGSTRHDARPYEA